MRISRQARRDRGRPGRECSCLGCRTRRSACSPKAFSVSCRQSPLKGAFRRTRGRDHALVSWVRRLRSLDHRTGGVTTRPCRSSTVMLRCGRFGCRASDRLTKPHGPQPARRPRPGLGDEHRLAAWGQKPPGSNDAPGRLLAAGHVTGDSLTLVARELAAGQPSRRTP